jgi:hypothetical protein
MILTRCSESRLRSRIGCKQSKLDGASARISSVEIHGLCVYATMGHANGRCSGPENGGASSTRIWSFESIGRTTTKSISRT